MILTEKKHSSPKKGESSQAEQPLKMKALMEATNTTKATILHYVKEGLLPQPFKSSPNMAYYGPSFVKLIKFIKYLQSRYRLSLAEIKEIIKEQDAGRDVLPFIEMKELVFGKQDSSLMNQKEFCEQAGLTDEVLKQCIEADVLIPKKDGQYDAKDLAIARILRAGFDAGMFLEGFQFYPRLAKEMVEAEMAIQARLIKGQSFNDAVLITMDLVSNARALRSYVIGRIFQKRATSQKVFLKSEEAEE